MNKIKKDKKMALRVGFEPTTAEKTAPVFETGALDHSATLA